MRSGIGNSAQDPIYVTNGTAAGAALPAGSATDPVNTQAAPLPLGTDRSGTAQTTVGGSVLVPANTSRRGLEIQNVGANNIGFTENGTDPVIGAAGTYTILPNGTGRARTNRQIKVIAVTGATAFTATEW